MLPNGVYTIEASSFGKTPLAGVQTISVNGAPLSAPAMRLLPSSLIPVYVREEFTRTDNGSMRMTHGDSTGEVTGPRRYLSITLDSADDVGLTRSVSLREPTGPQDDSLVIAGAQPGSYWVRVHSSRGYAASVRSGNLDLQRRPLVVGAGGGAAPIEITMRDDMAEISGNIEGMKQTQPGPGSPNAAPGPPPIRAHIYCVPVQDSGGRFAEGWVTSEGTFDLVGPTPGTYRVLAFNDYAREFEYRSPEAMQAYESKGAVVRVSGGQKEHVSLHLLSASGSGDDQP